MTMDQGSSGSGDALQQTAGDVASRATDVAQQQIQAQVEPQLDRVADMLQQVADTVRQAGDQVRQDQPQVASITDAAAGQVEKASSFFRENDMNGVVREIEDVARRQPVLFVGAAVAIGALAARFLKASPSSGYAGGRAGFDNEYGRTYGEPSGGTPYGGI